MALILNVERKRFKQMLMFYNFLFPHYCRDKGISFLILCLRLFFGVLFMMHGLDKMTHFSSLSDTYPSVFGLGSYMTLMLSVFTEFCCSVFLITGLLVRITVIPMIVAMAVAFFDVHDAMMPEGELAFIYMVLFIILYATGPGRYSLDYLIDTKVQSERERK